MPMRTLSALVVLLGACAPDPSIDVDVHRAPIVNGMVDPGDPAVVALLDGGRAFCTGTLVSPHVVVTAAHCIDVSLGGREPSTLQAFFGTTVGADGMTIEVLDGEPSPL